MVLHGAIALLIGLVCGIPFAMATIRDWGGDAVRAWQVAHVGGVTIGVALIAIAAARPNLRLGPAAARAWLWSLVAAGYTFVLGAALAAVADVRGLTPRGSPLNAIVFASYLVGTAAAFAGTLLTIRGAWAGRG